MFEPRSFITNAQNHGDRPIATMVIVKLESEHKKYEGGGFEVAEGQIV